jgi:hypothetical protein
VLNRLLRIAAFTALIMGVSDLSYTLEVLFYVSEYLNNLCSVKLVGNPLSGFNFCLMKISQMQRLPPYRSG